MSDIDFDELDKAVASVLNAGASAQPPAASQQPTTDPVPSPVNEPAPIAVSSDDSKPAAVTAQSLHSQPVKPVQRGRFLDMVHPSVAVTRPTPRASVRPAPIVSNGAFVSDVIASPATQAQVRPAAVASPAAPANKGATSDSDTPPTDFFGAPPVSASEKTDGIADTDEPPRSSEPAPSPFIPDAKVEKRPLGAFSTADAPALPSGAELDRRLAEIEGEESIAAIANDGPSLAKPIDTDDTAPKHVVAPLSSNLASAAVATPVSVSATPVAPAAKEHHGFPLLPHHDHAPKMRPSKPAKSGRGTAIWLTVALAVMLIGFGVGASLFILLFQ